MTMPRAILALVVVCTLSCTGLAETFRNYRTNEVLSGKVLGTAVKGGEEGFFIRTTEAKPRTLFLPKSEWRVVADEPAADDTAERPAPGPGAEADEPELRKSIGTGAGATADDALKAALMNAVEQAVGVLIDAQTIVDHNDVIQEKIIAASNAFVEKYDIVRQWEEGGLNRCRLIALVRSRQLRQRLEANRVIVAKRVDGESIAARVITEESATKSAAEIVKACFKGLPQSLLYAKAVGDPVPVPGNPSRLRIPIEIGFDQKRYSELVAEIEPKIAKVSRSAVLVAAKFERKNRARARAHGYYYRPKDLTADSLRRAEANPVNPEPGVFASNIWFDTCIIDDRASIVADTKAGERLRAAFDAMSNKALQSGQRWDILCMLRGTTAAGAATFAVYAFDAGTLGSLPEGAHWRQLSVQLRLLDNAGIMIEEASIGCSSGYITFMGIGRGERWVLVRSQEGVRKQWADLGYLIPGGTRGLDYAGQACFVQSWCGNAYIDVGGPDQIKRIRKLEVSVRCASIGEDE